MSDKRNKKFNNLKDQKRPIILTKRDDKDHDEKPQQSSSDATPKILLKAKEKPQTPSNLSVNASISSSTSAPATISIASREGSVNSRISSPIPKHVNVAGNRDCKDLAAPVIIEQPIVQVPEMQKPVNIISDHYQLNNNSLEFLLDTNVNFFVVGIVGTQGVGKSTLLNILTSFKHSTDAEMYFKDSHSDEIFQTRSTRENVFSASPTTEGIEMFISKDRIIYLDCSPFLCNPYKKDHVLNEIDDLKMLIFLMSVCHLLIVVQDDFFNMNMIRLILCAEMMKPHLDKDQPEEYLPSVLFVKNMASNLDFTPEAKDHANKMYKYLFRQSKLKICPGVGVRNDEDAWEQQKNINSIKSNVNMFVFPDMNRCKRTTYTGYPDVNMLISEFRQRVFMSPRHQFQQLQQGLFSEKNWSHLVTNTWEAHKNNYFLRKYDNFKEKEQRLDDRQLR